MIRTSGFKWIDCLLRLRGVATNLVVVSFFFSQILLSGSLPAQVAPRERILINDDWRFTKGDPTNCTLSLLYDVREQKTVRRLAEAEADGNSSSTSATNSTSTSNAQVSVIKQWILPTGNNFIKDPSRKFVRPEGNLGDGVAYVQPDFDDSAWPQINLPHDWAITGPFTHAGGGGMGRLPTAGVGWYRKKLEIPATDSGKSIFLDVDGAMSYSTVWLNGQLVGGWPFGYASWRVDLTPFVKFGSQNELVIRLDNPPNSSRWYPGAGIYRNVWLVKTSPVHVAHWGTYVTTPEIKTNQARVHVEINIENTSASPQHIDVINYILAPGQKISDVEPKLKYLFGVPMAPESKLKFRRISHDPASLFAVLAPGASTNLSDDFVVSDPKLWNLTNPNLYRLVTRVYVAADFTNRVSRAKLADEYETPFGIRTVKFDPDKGVFVNGEHIDLKGVCDHHDLGALGAAFNCRAAQRQLEMLQAMGCNAIRTSHNPPAPELLELADKMGFLVMDESFDVWVRQKTPLDFHLIFPDWHEQDLRAHLRRDRNHPSVIMWSIGNEVGEQFTFTNGATVAKELCDIVREEDPTRPTTTAMNWAQPTNPFTATVDIIGLNYQGAGIRKVPGKYPEFHAQFPDKMIFSSESADAWSSRGEYMFPVTTNISMAAGPDAGEDRMRHQVSAYELYSSPFGSSADRVFASQEKNPFAGGEFVWTGWDYLGEPDPFGSSRSSYSGIIDLAGFKKDRFYLYQAHWRPDFPMAHILPHWTWPERVGQVTPVHVFTSGDEAELFLNGKSLGRKKKGAYEYRLRWDDVVYQPGVLKVVAYKNGKKWATDEMKTAGEPAKLKLEPDRSTIVSDGKDLSFVTMTVTDKSGLTAPRADNRIHFDIEGPGEIVATDNGDPTSFEPFQSHDRNSFNGLCLVIVRGKPGQTGTIKIVVRADGLSVGTTTIKTIRQSST